MFADTGKTIPEVAGSKRKSVDRQKTPEKFSKVTKRKKGYGSAVKGINYTHILQSLWSFMIFLLFCKTSTTNQAWICETDSRVTSQ